MGVSAAVHQFLWSLRGVARLVQPRDPLLVLAGIGTACLVTAQPATPSEQVRPEAPLTVAHYAPEADARVEQAAPNDNFGSSSYLETDGGGDPEVDSYLQFSVSGLAGVVTHATLRLHANTSTVEGPSVYVAGNDWSERQLTWQNRPNRLSGAIASAGGIAAGGWVEYDVTPAVSGDGTYTFQLATSSSDGVDFSSREGAYAPALEIETETDTTAPSVPAGLAAGGTDDSAVSLQWQPSFDNVGVAGYDLFLNGDHVAETTDRSYTFSGLRCGTSYALGVDAFDAAENVSARATIIGSTTACDSYLKTLDSTDAEPIGLSVDSNNCTLARSGLGDVFTLLPASTRCTWTNQYFSHMHRHEVFEVSQRFDLYSHVTDWTNNILIRPYGNFGNANCNSGGNSQVMLVTVRIKSDDHYWLELRGGPSLQPADQSPYYTQIDMGPVVQGRTDTFRFDIVTDYEHGAATVWHNGVVVYDNRDRPLGFHYDCDGTTDLSNFDLRMQHGIYRGWTTAPLILDTSGFGFLVSEPES